MGKTAFICWILFSLFRISIQLICSTDCPNIQVNYSNPFIEPICPKNPSIKICTGRITAYYNGKHYPKYINYTLGLTGDLLEKKHEKDIETFGLHNLTKYQVIVNPRNEETIITADIYCTDEDNCALSTIKSLFIKYNNQLNLYYELKPLMYVDPSPKKLVCFDISTGSSQQCDLRDSNPVCISYLKDLKQECSKESDISLHEEFTRTSPETFEVNLMNEIIKCNKDDCNKDEILATIQNISRNYAYGTVSIKNNTNRLAMKVNQIFYILVFLFYFF